MAKEASRKAVSGKRRVAGSGELALKKILVPIDFSETSVGALRHAIGLAKQFKASLCLLYVYEPPTFLAGYHTLPITVPDDQVMQKARIQLDSLVPPEGEPGLPLQSFVRRGKAFDEIVKFAQEQAVDLIVISTHGYTGLKHTLMGSTAERVIRHAQCPVLVVR